MEELLDLMDEEERAPTNANHHPPQSNDNHDDMDELLDLMDENYENETSQSQATSLERSHQAQVVTPPQPNSLRRPKARDPSSSSGQPTQHTTKSKPVSAGIDDKLGIRMTDRKISSVDLLDMISINPHYTPATLSAMTLQSLSSLLIDPPIRVDPATVTGKLNMVTVGVVFSNSGTRTSAKGGSFCILDIGNFVSGPCVTVMLFGDVYSKYVRTCRPGKVVAVVNPSLLPVRQGEKTRISVTVNNSNQFHLVAQAMDYGICKGTTRVKGSDGKWTAFGNCKQWIDKRVCEFCDKHRKQKEKKSSKSSSAVGGSFQQLRAEGQTAVATSRFGTISRFAVTGGAENNSLQTVPMQMKKTLAEQRGSIVVQQSQKANNGGNRFLNGGAANRVASGISTSATPPQQETAVAPKNRLLNVTVPRQMKSKSLTNVTNTANPYSKQSDPVTAQKPKLKPKTGIVGSSKLRGDGDWFQAASKPRPAHSRSGSLARLANKAMSKKRAINTDGGGFDGSVQVPKPSRLFSGGQQQMISDSGATKMPDRSRSSTSIMESQAAIARMLQAAKDDSQSQLIAKSKAPSKKGATSSQNSFYASVGDIDLEKVKNTKSKFAREVEAEEYAKSRQKVVELERLEGSKNASKKRQANDTKNLAVEYICKTCCTCSAYPPTSCLNSKHEVTKIRKLSEQQSKDAKRTKLHEKDAADGGLRLGAGNEWARNLKDFHS